MWLLLMGAPIVAFSQEIESVPAAARAVHEAAASGGHEEGLPAHAVPVAHVGSFPITNSMIVTWIVALGLILFAQLATRNMKDVPGGLQNFWEWMVEGLYNFLEGIIGRDLVHRTFWFFATIFIFILFSNWAGLIPGLGTVGWNVTHADGATEFQPWFRGANADLNMTLAMSLVFFACWTWWALKTNGPGGFIKHLFAPKGDTTGLLKLLMIVVFLAVGCLEVFSILFRPVSLSFRLYGNIFAGENMLESMASLVQHPAWAKTVFSFVLPIPFYFMELLVGLVQALVFMLLTAVFTMLICQHDDEHEHAHH